MNKTVHTELVPYGSEAYAQTLQLRHIILRAPLGLKLSEVEIKKEHTDLHLAGYIDQKLVACMVLSPQDENSVKMRQVAVAEVWQGQGIGKDLVWEAEKIAKAKNFRKIVLSARDIVVPFYQKLGYTIVSEVFIEVGIPHVKMEKKL